MVNLTIIYDKNLSYFIAVNKSKLGEWLSLKAPGKMWSTKRMKEKGKILTNEGLLYIMKVFKLSLIKKKKNIPFLESITILQSLLVTLIASQL